MNNNDERDYAEERYNANLLRDERDPDDKPEEENPDAFREVRVTLTVRVPADETATAAEVGQAIDGALDEPGNYGNDWGQWEVGGVTAVELPEPAGTPEPAARRVEIGLSRASGALARDMYLAAVTAVSQVTVLTLDGHEVAAVVPRPAPDHAANVEAYLAEQLDRDDASLAEIAVEATKIATGAETYVPVEDDEDDDPELTGGESPAAEF